MSRVMEAISNGAAQSWQMDNRSISMVKGSFDFGFALDLMIKDLNIVIDEASKERINLEVTDLIKKKYQTLSKLGYGNDDTSALIRLFD
jgi:3-hydroxyisobutyrate dehydrogenase-like beta-hydroxyacid dehydrogenase